MKREKGKNYIRVKKQKEENTAPSIFTKWNKQSNKECSFLQKQSDRENIQFQKFTAQGYCL